MKYPKLILAATATILALCAYLSGDAPPSAAGDDLRDDPVPNFEGGAIGNLRSLSSFTDPRSVASKSAEGAGDAGARSAEERGLLLEEDAIHGRGGRSWPTGDELVVPPGTYSQGPAADRPSRQGPGPVPSYGRVLLYVTSHFSAQHEMYLRYCWPNLLAHSPLLRGADVAVHLNPNNPSARRGAMDLLREVFADQDLTVYLRTYEGALMEGGSRHRNQKKNHDIRTKQTGAVMALNEGVHYGYFEGYDWVIRANPDVLIRDDSFFRQAMADPTRSALIVNCQRDRKDIRRIHLHTDFFVVRPEVLLKEEFPEEILSGGAEMSFTTSVMNTVLKSNPKNYAWIPGADPASKRACRVGEGRDLFDVPVVHEHALHPDICRVPEADVPIVESVFPKWPESWEPVL